ncbi:hypothetical protein B9Q13_04460 [Candidatus Marsarchaeota G2 archaeon ECH_B_SAG-G16]|jgi:hypothetical protein|nr:MAG: hypothetical protein B9Q01_09965 [Candidatus Marsarchaeota G1 archaeon OSP_D]PSN85732.1 MAG: hypothetical protein B9Q00_10800 [Candidatus Marsarchaeota G1 archaeon OSP_C]PSO04486.1 MAG: hypothetical protein B9Q13_04460 [Candidatus Marsarchaeota G2 archaeon ECH_B_SAG-G16]
MVTNQAYNFLKTCLGILWLLDATLQLQPLMFTKLFPEEVVLPAFESLPFKAFFILSGFKGAEDPVRKGGDG